MKSNLDKRKIFGTIIGILIWSICIVFFTYSWYEWKSNNMNVVFSIEEATNVCEMGPNVNVSNIGPVLDYHDGVIATFQVQNNSSGASTVSLSLNITSISDTLLVDSFKYILLKGDANGTVFEEVNIGGDFSTFQIGSNMINNLVSVDGNTTNTFQFIVYIDGSMYNNPNMMEGSMEANLEIGNCDERRISLNSVEVGSYVAYTGTNGCPEGHCDGTNANYVSDTNMGYCFDSSYKFSVNGWRVGYIQNDTAYLVSAGATECMCTSADGTASSSSCSDYETTNGVPLHLANLDNKALTYYNKALTYCNPTYAYGGACNANSAWAMDATDFQAITGSVLSSSSCYNSSEDAACGYGNSLINNGGYYWYATAYNSSSAYTFFWSPYRRSIYINYSSSVFGVRPVLRLASSVQVVGGSGTYEDPYQITNPTTSTVQYLSDVEPGSYVAYTGTNGCPDGHCDGTNANYVSDDNMGYCYTSGSKFSVNGWRVGYIQNDTAYLVSAGATECMCTNEDGTTSGDRPNSGCGSCEYTRGRPLHLANLASKALTYCNPAFAYGGICNSNSAWAMDATDFQIITGMPIYYNSSSDNSCYQSSADAACGYGNDLIDNGGYYWYATVSSGAWENTFHWNAENRYVYNNMYSSGPIGVRPVLRLAPSVRIVGGSGTYEDPYQISNS